MARFPSFRFLPPMLRRPSGLVAVEELEPRVLLNVGNLDPQFNGGGTVLTHLGLAAQGNAVVSLGDGNGTADDSLIVAGTVSNGGHQSFALMRYNGDGSLDTLFGSNGVATADFGPANAVANTLVGVPGPGGTIDAVLAAGFAVQNGQEVLALAEFNLDGTLDDNFGPNENGLVTCQIPGTTSDDALAVAIQPVDGAIVVAGTAQRSGGNQSEGGFPLGSGGKQDMLVVRFTSFGTLDQSFGTNGSTLIDYGTGDDSATAVAVASSGNIVVAGSATVPDGPATKLDFAVAELDSTGRLASDFNGGTVTTSFGRGDDSINGLALQPGGAVVVAGQVSDGTFDYVALARYQPDGLLDPTFGVTAVSVGPAGTITTSLGPSSDAANAMVIDPIGRITVAGFSLQQISASGQPDRNFGLARYNADGSVDQTFGINGQVTTDLGADDQAANALVATSNGKLVAAGFAVENGTTELALARYNADIRPIAADDVKTAPAQSGVLNGITIDVLANDFDPQPGDPIFVNGITTAGGDSVPVDGQPHSTPDGTFQSDGTAITWIPPAGFSGTYRFTYTDGNGWLTSPPANVTVVVLGPGTVPAGTLDPTFGATGLLIFGGGAGNNIANAVALRPDGNVVVAGSSFVFRSSASKDNDFSLLLTNPNGIPVQSFGTHGFVTTDFGKGDDAINAVAVQHNGEIVAVGSAFDGSHRELALARYDSHGNLDPTFGAGTGSFGPAGTVTTDFGSDAVAYGVILLPDGDIVVVGAALNPITGSDDFALAEYDGTGQLIASFGAGTGSFGPAGTVTTDFGQGDAVARAVVEAKGNIVVAGSASDGKNLDFALARYDANGALDPTFGAGTGTVTTDFGQGDAVATALVLQGNGDVVVAGSASNGTNLDFALARYSPRGLLDPTFGSGGLVTTSLGPGNDQANALAILPDGKLVAAGYSQQDNGSTAGLNTDFAVVRYTSAGQPDSSFGQDGEVFAPDAAEEQINALLLQAGGKVLVAGTINVTGDSEFALRRYNSDGSPDLTFAANLSVGAVQDTFGPSGDEANAVAIQPADGNIVVAGSTAGGTEFALLRLDGARGGVDSTFGTGGRVTTPFGTSTAAAANALAVLPNGEVLVAGNALNPTTGNEDFALAEYIANGTLDPAFGAGTGSFGPAGTVTTDFGSGDGQFTFTTVNAIALLLNSDGSVDRIFVAGEAYNASTLEEDFALACYNADGSLDTTFGAATQSQNFGPAGTVTTDFGLGDAVGNAIALELNSDGTLSRIVVAGYAVNMNSENVFALAQYNPDGSLDTTFGSATQLQNFGPAGTVTTDFGDGGDAVATAMALQLNADGTAQKIVVGGSTANADASQQDFALARYNLDGTLDTTFGSDLIGRTSLTSPDGTVTTAFSPALAGITALAIQAGATPAQSKIVATGTSSDNGLVQFTVARYGIDGTLDPTFGTGGTTVLDFGNSSTESANALAVQADGNIVVAGTRTNFTTQKSVVLVVRLLGSPINDVPPVALDQTAATSTDTPVIVPVLSGTHGQDGGAFDPDNGPSPLRVIRVTQGADGRVRINADGTLTYTPDADFTGTDHFTYTVFDGLLSATGTVTVNVFAPPILGPTIDDGSGLVTGEQWVAVSSPTAEGVYQGTLGTPPFTAAGPFALLTNGDVSVATDNTSAGVDNHTRLRGAFDVSILELTIDVPAGDNYLNFDFSFDSNEYPLFRDRGFNGTFLAELDEDTWSVDPATNAISAPNNFAYAVTDPTHQPVSTAGPFFDDSRVVTLTGTLYNGGTPLLQAGTPITPGVHHLYLSIFKVGDGQIDSGVFINHLTALHLPGSERLAGVHQPPLAQNSVAPLTPGRSTVVPVLSNAIDFDGGGLTIVGTTQPPHPHGTIVVRGGTIVYTPNRGFDGVDTFTYTVSDRQGGTSTATVTMSGSIEGASSAGAVPTQSGVAGLSDVTAKLTSNVAGSPPNNLTVLDYFDNPLPVLVPGADQNASAFFDVQVPGTNAADEVVATFGPPPGGKQLLFFDGLAWVPVRGSGGAAPLLLADGSFSVLLDSTSHPRVNGLGGTVFTVAVSAPATATQTTVTPPAASKPLATNNAASFIGDAPAGAAPSVTFQSTSSLTLTLVPSQIGQVSASQSALTLSPYAAGAAGESDPNSDDAATWVSFVLGMVGDGPKALVLYGGVATMKLLRQQSAGAKPGTTTPPKETPPPKPAPAKPPTEEQGALFENDAARRADVDAVFSGPPLVLDPADGDGAEPVAPLEEVLPDTGGAAADLSPWYALAAVLVDLGLGLGAEESSRER